MKAVNKQESWGWSQKGFGKKRVEKRDEGERKKSAGKKLRRGTSFHGYKKGGIGLKKRVVKSIRRPRKVRKSGNARAKRDERLEQKADPRVWVQFHSALGRGKGGA